MLAIFLIQPNRTVTAKFKDAIVDVSISITDKHTTGSSWYFSESYLRRTITVTNNLTVELKVKAECEDLQYDSQTGGYSYEYRTYNDFYYQNGVNNEVKVHEDEGGMQNEKIYNMSEKEFTLTVNGVVVYSNEPFPMNGKQKTINGIKYIIQHSNTY